MVEQADTKDLKSFGRNTVPVRSRLAAPKQYNPNQIFPRGKWVRIICLFQEIRRCLTQSHWGLPPQAMPNPGLSPSKSCIIICFFPLRCACTFLSRLFCCPSFVFRFFEANMQDGPCPSILAHSSFFKSE